MKKILVTLFSVIGIVVVLFATAPLGSAPTFVELLQALKGQDAVYEMKFWKVPNTPEARMNGVANQCRFRVTLKPGYSLSKVVGWTAVQLEKLLLRTTGTFSWGGGEYPYYDIYPVDPSFCNPTAPAQNPRILPALDAPKLSVNEIVLGLAALLGLLAGGFWFFPRLAPQRIRNR